MRNNDSYGSGYFSMIKGVGFALLLSLLLSVIFANVLIAAPMGDKAIYFVNQIVKMLSVAIGTFAFVRGEKGWLKGGGIGLLFTAFSYLTFSALGGDFSLSPLLIGEILLALLTGVICGICAVHRRHR